MSGIISSLLDVDFYKFTMGQLVFRKFPDVPVTYGFKNRTMAVNIADYIEEAELRRELDFARTLRFNNSELHFLRGTNEYQERMFGEDYLEFLRNLQLPDYRLDKVGDTYQLEFPGRWCEAIYWETIALAIVNELYFQSLLKDMSQFEQETIEATGRLNLKRKIEILRDHPEITFCDFGTRRRFSRAWQEYAVKTLAVELPNQLLGTSNTKLAMDYGLVPMGTSAHELFMVLACINGDDDKSILFSPNQVLNDWWEQYGWGLSIALTDTFGSDSFFRTMTTEQARDWKGLRQDSGNPFIFGERAIAFYRRCGIDPQEKLIVFSDGLDVETILRLTNRFAHRIKVTFGWGTNLTNDLGLKPLSLVVKVVEANGRGAVKLSDNLAKALGQPKDVERYKRIFGYTNTLKEACRY